jgi:hypothetical protein
MNHPSETMTIVMQEQLLSGFSPTPSQAAEQGSRMPRFIANGGLLDMATAREPTLQHLLGAPQVGERITRHSLRPHEDRLLMKWRLCIDDLST